MAKHRVGIKQRQPGTGAHPLMRYDQATGVIAVGSASVGVGFSLVLFDNSGMAGNKYLKIGKMTIQWFSNFNQQNLFYMILYKAKEGSGAILPSDETTVRDLRSEGRLIRGPWTLSTVGPGVESSNTMWQRKTIVLQDLLLDPNDDLKLGTELRTQSSTGTNEIRVFTKTYWKVVE